MRPFFLPSSQHSSAVKIFWHAKKNDDDDDDDDDAL